MYSQSLAKMKMTYVLDLKLKKRLVGPLSMANYDEMRSWLTEDMKTEKGLTSKNKNPVYAYVRTYASSAQEHEWPDTTF